MIVPGVYVLAPRARALGFLPVVAGVLLHRSGTQRFRSAGTTIEPQGRPGVLVEDGVFALTRNPMYLAGAVILAGVAVLLGAATPPVLVPLYLAASARWFIRAEERVLEERFGDLYLGYRRRVRRWL
jgi:protein-S-isoprenylcysteine O-methyltransferase Ste14